MSRRFSFALIFFLVTGGLAGCSAPDDTPADAASEAASEAAGSAAAVEAIEAQATRLSEAYMAGDIAGVWRDAQRVERYFGGLSPRRIRHTTT